MLENSGDNVSPSILKLFKNKSTSFSSSITLPGLSSSVASFVTLILYVLVVFPSGAVTTIFIVLVPTSKLVFPVILTPVTLGFSMVIVVDSDFIISPTESTAVFIQNPEKFHIPSDVVIVGIENGENFRYIRHQKYLFGNKKILFVSRYPQSSDLKDWLRGISNEYIHFGDYDLAGISIYQSEFYRILGERASFFVPKDIEERLRTGNEKLYNAQYLRYRNMKIIDSRLNWLVEMIHRYRKVYEQEGYIV